MRRSWVIIGFILLAMAGKAEHLFEIGMRESRVIV